MRSDKRSPISPQLYCGPAGQQYGSRRFQKVTTALLFFSSRFRELGFHTRMSRKPALAIAASISVLIASAGSIAARGGQPNPTPTPAAPPAPVLAAPATGASLAQPISLNWSAPPTTTGAIGSYTWQVGTTSAFTNIIASGFTNQEADATIPVRTFDRVSGLPNATYFWRVKASEASANGGVDTAWSAVRTFTVTGLGPAPATPT